MIQKKKENNVRRKTRIGLIVSIVTIVFFISIFLITLSKNRGTPCDSFSVEKCPDRCVVCPPCAVCSSISCQTEEFCKDMGFDRRWYEAIKERLESFGQ